MTEIRAKTQKPRKTRPLKTASPLCIAYRVTSALREKKVDNFYIKSNKSIFIVSRHGFTFGLNSEAKIRQDRNSLMVPYEN